MKRGHTGREPGERHAIENGRCSNGRADKDAAHCQPRTDPLDRFPALETPGREPTRSRHSPHMEIDMGRRKEFKTVSNDLLGSFVSRNNDLDGYWALGQFQTYLQSTSEDRLWFDLVPDTGRGSAFPTVLSNTQRAFQGHLTARRLPRSWVRSAMLMVAQRSLSELICTFTVTDDRGKIFASQRTVTARPHDPNRELRRPLRTGGSAAAVTGPNGS